MLDTQRMSVFTIQNRLNSPTSSNTPSFVSDTAKTGSSSAAIYCTKPVILENNSKALDIRLTANIRATSEVEMYFRTSGSDDDVQIIRFSMDVLIVMVVQMYQSCLVKTIQHLKKYKFSRQI